MNGRFRAKPLAYSSLGKTERQWKFYTQPWLVLNLNLGLTLAGAVPPLPRGLVSDQTLS